MRRKKVLVFYKKSIFELYSEKNPNHKILALIKKKDKLVEPILNAHKENLQTREEFFKLISEYKNLDISVREKLPKTKIKSFDIIIVLGGDGTILDVARCVRQTPIIGINSSPSSSKGHFCWNSIFQFNKEFSSILDGNIKPVELSRLLVSINDIPLPYPGLNDVLISHFTPVATSRYILKVKDIKECQRSSGIWVSTAAGSTAAIYSAGGKKMELTSNLIQYFVREPFVEDRKKYKLLNGIVMDNEMTITLKMLNGCVYIDGNRFKKELEFGDKITFKIHSEPLKIYLSPQKEME